MVGNPFSGNPATVTGYDFAARWNPTQNGYTISGYREAQTLAVGEAMWIFSYANTSIIIKPA
jgi:hypothetical protein